MFKWSICEKIDCAVDDNFMKFDFFREDLLHGAATSKFKASGESILVKFCGGNPTSGTSDGMFFDERGEHGAFFRGELFGIGEIMVECKLFGKVGRRTYISTGC